MTPSLSGNTSSTAAAESKYQSAGVDAAGNYSGVVNNFSSGASKLTSDMSSDGTGKPLIWIGAIVVAIVGFVIWKKK